MNRLRGFQLLSIGALLAASFHALVAGKLIIGDGSPVARHAAFVAVSVGAAWYLMRRPLWGLVPYVALVAQQTRGHGARIIELWSEGQVDGISIVVLLALYVGLVLLVLDARDRSPRVRRFVCPFPRS